MSVRSGRMKSAINCIARLKAAAPHLDDDQILDIVSKVDEAARKLSKLETDEAPEFGRKYKKLGPDVVGVMETARDEAAAQYIIEAAKVRQRQYQQATKIAARLDDLQAIVNAKVSPIQAALRM